MDPRSLALFRVLLGITLLLDLAGRAPYVRAFYSDQGVLSRELAVQSGFAGEWLCFHLGTGSSTGIALLLFLQAVLAIGVLVGWRTRWMVLGSWVMLNSLHVRNPFVNDRGDLELALLLFWGFFLPLAQVWSVDARGREKTSVWEAKGLNSAAYVAQIGLIYLLAGITKYGDFWLVRGDGLYHSLRSPLFASAAAEWLSQAPRGLLWLGNYSVIAGEVFVGLLLLCPYSVPLLRRIAVILIVLFHLAVALLFHLGLFPWIGLVGALALLPTALWNSPAGATVERALNHRLGDNQLKTRPLPKPLSYFLALCLFLVLLSNATNRVEGEAFSRGSLLTGLTNALRFDQHWELFSPIPPYDGTYSIHSTEDSRTVFSAPNADTPFRSHRWRMLMIASLYPRFSVVREGLVRELTPNPHSGEYIYRFEVHLIDPDGESKQVTSWTLWRGQLGGERGKVLLK